MANANAKMIQRLKVAGILPGARQSLSTVIVVSLDNSEQMTLMNKTNFMKNRH